MYSKRRQLPLEVSSWMEKDLTLRKITANSRLLTNDTRQNIILGRQFFSDLLTLSFSRYRKIAEHDFEKKMFLRNQYNKAEVSMPGLVPYIDQLAYNMNRGTTSRIQSSRKGDNPFVSPSAQSFLSRPGTKSDPTYNRRQQSSIRQIQTAQIKKSRPVVPSAENSTTATNERPKTVRHMSRETLNRLAQPKGHRFKSAVGSEHVRSNTSEATTAEEVFGQIEQPHQEALPPMHDTLLEKPKSAVHDKRFHHLLEVFNEVHPTQTSNTQTFKSIVEANTSLQDDAGQWKMEHPSVSSHKVELKRHRQVLSDKLHGRIDVFLIDIRA